MPAGSLLIIDALNHLFRSYHGLPPLSTSKGVPTGAVYGFVKTLMHLHKTYGCTHWCAVYDTPGSKAPRRALFPEYKAHRGPCPPDLPPQIELSKEVLTAFGIPQLAARGVEADDLIASLALRAEAAGMLVLIASSDKDLMQVVTPNVRILNSKEQVIGEAEVAARFGVPPKLVRDVLALAGDTSDNIPGVPGIGEKTAGGYVATYGGLEEVLAAPIKGKRGDALRKHAADARLSQALVQLRTDCPIELSLEQMIKTEPNPVTLYAMLDRLEFNSMAARPKED